jgi:hypothetical protein
MRMLQLPEEEEAERQIQLEKNTAFKPKKSNFLKNIFKSSQDTPLGEDEL